MTKAEADRIAIKDALDNIRARLDKLEGRVVEQGNETAKDEWEANDINTGLRIKTCDGDMLVVSYNYSNDESLFNLIEGEYFNFLEGLTDVQTADYLNENGYTKQKG